MINESTSTISTDIRGPILLRPTGKDSLWGGSRLNDDFGKNIPMTPLAETWECSTHPDGPSYAVGGVFDGITLAEILKKHPDYLGEHAHGSDELPVLVKFIDAAQNLSVQVHPDDEYAAEHENGSRGKTEMWYVLDSDPGSSLFYGLSRNVTPNQVRKAVADGTLEKYLQKTCVSKDDVFFVNAGTIHGIGAGVLVAEIQESSNITYRLYDYNRVDKNGNKRELHLDKALEVSNLKRNPKPRQPMRVLRYRRGWASELLCRCQYFQVDRILLNTEQLRELVDFKTDSLSFNIFLCVDGCGSLFCKNEAMQFFKGDCVFVPSDSDEIRIHGRAQLLRISC